MWVIYCTDNTSKGVIMEQKQIIAIVAVVAVVAIVGVAAFVMMQPSDDKTLTPKEYANDALKAIKDTNSKMIEEFTLIEDKEKTATLCTGKEIGSKVRWITITTENAADNFAKDKAEETFNKNINSDTITIMSKTVPCNHITLKDGLKDGVGYWYTYPDSYDMLEYIGYKDKVFIHMKIKLDDKDNSTTAADIDKIIKAVIKVL